MQEVTIHDLFEITDDGIIIFSPVYDDQKEIINFRHEQVNETALRLLNRQRQDLQGKHLLEVFPDLEDSDLFNQYVRVIETGNTYRTEFQYQNQGLNTWFKNIVYRINQQLLVRFSDISEYRQLLQESSQNEGLYQALVKGLPDTDVLLIDRQFNIRISKGAPLRAYGYTSTVERDTQLTNVLDEDATRTVTRICRQCFRGKTIREEVSVDGTIYRLSFVPTYDYDGTAFGCLIVTEDIGVFSLTEDELRNKLYALESAQESLEQFAYVASHDLQEPLRKIQAFGGRIKTRYADKFDDTGQDYFNRMQSAAKRMQTLIDDLLKYSRVGRIQNAFEPIDLNQLLQEVISDLETTIDESGATVEVDDLPTIEGEITQLRQLFQNRLSNAIKFKREGIPPRISIKSRRLKPEEVDSPNSVSEPYEITVADNGIGFDEKYLDHIFNIFQRLHGRNQYPGTGIGLAICRKIAENHQGDIYATSEEEKGTTFYVILPKNQPLPV
ncbi:MAG: ATP-binding protein [Bacteroidota bacterium]